MPTDYKTPGPYVEEVPAAGKPIAGVGTAVAAFVGLAPAGPLDTPQRISNWTQFARLFTDPAHRERGPFMEGAYLAHAVFGFYQNGGTVCWVVRVGAEPETRSARAALPAAHDRGIEAARIVALEGVAAAVRVEVTEEPPGGDGKDTDAGDPTYRIVVIAGTTREEHPGLTLRKGRMNVVTKVNASSKLVRIEETSAALAETRLAPGTYALATPTAAPQPLDAGRLSGDVADRTGVGSIAAHDEVTMLVVPDAAGLDDVALRDVQTKLIAHCEGRGDRMAILDAPRDLRPQDVLAWRNETAGYDSKMAALYWPWIEVLDPLTKQPTLVPPSGHVAGVWARVDGQRGVHKSPANETIQGRSGSGSRSRTPSRAR